MIEKLLKNEAIVLKWLVLIGPVCAFSFAAYQYFVGHELKWREIRYQEAKPVYQELLERTSYLSNSVYKEKIDIIDFEEKLDELNLFLDSDFMLYKGDYIHLRASFLNMNYRACLNGLKESSDFVCDKSKLNGFQYRLSICARLSLDQIRKHPNFDSMSIPLSFEEFIKSLNDAKNVENTKMGCRS
ncbi:hypothetical protein [Shewanella sp. 125m-1]